MKKNEWCEFDPIAGKMLKMFGTILICLYIFIFALYVIYYPFNLMGYNFFSALLVSIIISFPIMFIMGRKIWKRQMQFLSILIDSYSIKLEIDIKTIQKLASNIKYYLNKSGIKYQSSENEYENGSLNYSYHRQDNSHSMIEIDKFKRNVKISIFCREFDNKKNALELKKMIWDENEKSNKI